jgi:hypothetical protein
MLMGHALVQIFYWNKNQRRWQKEEALTLTKKFAWLSIMQNGSVHTDPGKALMNLLKNGAGTGQGKSVGVVLVGEACERVFRGDVRVGVVGAGSNLGCGVDKRWGDTRLDTRSGVRITE